MSALQAMLTPGALIATVIAVALGLFIVWVAIGIPHWLRTMLCAHRYFRREDSKARCVHCNKGLGPIERVRKDDTKIERIWHA